MLALDSYCRKQKNWQAHNLLAVSDYSKCYSLMVDKKGQKNRAEVLCEAIVLAVDFGESVKNLWI